MLNLGFKHLSNRITFYFFILIIAALIILALLINRMFSERLTNEMNIVMVQTLDLASNDLNNSIEAVRVLYYSIVNSYPIQQKMEAWHGLDHHERSEAALQMQQELNRFRTHSADILSIVAIDQAFTIIDPLYLNHESTDIFLAVTEFDDFLSLGAASRLSTPNGFPILRDDPQFQYRTTITFYGIFYDRDFFSTKGYIAINVRKRFFFGAFDDLLENAFSAVFVFNENDDIVYERSDGIEDVSPLLGLKRNQGELHQVDDKFYLVYSQALNGYPLWRIVGLVDYHTIVEQTRQMNTLIFATTFVLLLFVLFVSFAISKKITTPLSTLNKAMLTVGKGEWLQIESSSTKDEIHELICGFNAMVENLMRLSADVVQEQEQKKKYEVSMIKTQLRLLQSQINPHFIHNTLITMNYLAKKEKNTQLVEMISAFNSLLRSSMSYEEMFISIAEEIENLRNYINIQRIRYADEVAISFQCNVEPEANDAVLPKLILQPFVENALHHGIAPAGGGVITVTVEVKTVEAKGEFLNITVHDDGVGMSSDRLEEVIHGRHQNTRSRGQVGIDNVNERLVLHYGELCRLKIDSVPDHGTTISFAIPFATDEGM